MKRRISIGALAGVLLILALSGCGWHLRGAGAGSAIGYNVYVKNVGALTVSRALRTALVNRGAKVVYLQKNSDVIIEIIGQRYDRRVLSVDPDTGKVREVELSLTTEFLMRGADGNLLVPRETLEWELDYIFDEGSILGTTEQDAIIQNDLAESAATAIVLRMQAIKVAAVEPATTEADVAAQR